MGLSCRSRKVSKVPSRDGRSPDGVLLRRTKAALVAHVGGRPSATQQALIDRAAMLTLHIARMDQRAMEQGEFSEWASRQYLAWSNTLNRTMAALGITSPAATNEPAAGQRALQEHLAARAAAKAASEAPRTAPAP
jgi:hypothetical protein